MFFSFENGESVANMLAIFLPLGIFISSVLASPLNPFTSSLLLPPSSNVSLSLHALQGPFRAKCFTQPAPPTPKWPPAHFPDCTLAIAQMMEGRKVTSRLVISRNEDDPFPVPKTFGYGSCAVLVDLVGAKEGKEAVFDVILVKDLVDAS